MHDKQADLPSNVLLGQLQWLGWVLFDVVSLVLISQVLTKLLGCQAKLARQVHCNP